MFDHDDHSFVSDTTLGPWQLRPIKSELFARPTHHACVDGLMGASKGDLGLAALAMYRYDDGGLGPAADAHAGRGDIPARPTTFEMLRFPWLCSCRSDVS